MPANESGRGLVGGDGEKPGPETPLRIKLLGRLMNLKKCLLKDVFGAGPIAQESNEKMIEFALIATHRLRKRGVVAVAIFVKKLLVQAAVPSGGRGKSRGRHHGSDQRCCSCNITRPPFTLWPLDIVAAGGA